MARFGDFDQYLDNAGDPLAEGKLYFYESGTTTPKTTYSDVNNSIPNTNPVLLSAAGRQPNIFFDGVAKVILTDNDDVQLIVRDPVGETATDFGDQWVATKIYNATDVVLGSDGVYYRSLINGNQGNNPVTTTGNWTLLYSVEWNAGITYQVGAVVTYDGEQYQSLQGSNLNQNPSSASSYWVLLSFAWLATATYAEDQNAVGTDGILYTSLQNGNIGNDPATSPAYWVGTSAAAAASAVAAAASAAAALVSENAAAADAVATAADVVQTGLDAAATAADAIATAADRVQTGLDAAATAADVILTNADAVATAADRVQTGLDAAATSADAIATAADRVQTGLDVIATNADAIATAADAIATAADVVQTGLDVVATSADVVQTGLDVTAAAGSASAASGSASAAAASAAAAAASYDAFDDRYLGDKASDPTLDNDGNALLTGALYFNTTSNDMKVYNGSAWQVTAINPASPTFTGTVTADGLSLGDNDKATFGNGNDLQIYHDSGNSLIEESGVGNLIIRGSGNVDIQPSGGGAYMARFAASGASSLYYNNAQKLATTATGIDVTGTATMDGLTVTGTLGNFAVDTQGVIASFSRPSTSYIRASDVSGALRFDTGGSIARLNIANNGDISFYEDTGTTPELTWDASTESLNLSSNSAYVVTNSGRAVNGLDIAGAEGSLGSYGGAISLGNGRTGRSAIAAVQGHATDGDANGLAFFTHVSSGSTADSAKRMEIAANGDISFYEDTGTTPKFFWNASTERLGIGTSSPSATLEVGALTSGSTGNVVINHEGGSLPTLQVKARTNRSVLQISDNDTTGYLSAENGLFSIGRITGLSANNINIDSSNNVGIGTSSPSTSKLHLQGSTGTASAVRVESTGVDSDAYYIADNDASVWTWGIDGGLSDAWILSNAFGLGTPKMTVTTGGNVGIGTTSPRTLLHVTGLTADDDPALGSSAAPVFISNTANSYGLNIGVNNAGAGWLQAQSNTASTAYNLLLNPLGGNVGIGTSSPDTELHIEDATGNAVVQIESSAAGYSAVFFGDVNDGDVGQIRYDHSDNSMRFGTNATAEVMRIDSSGNVGIGTASPIYTAASRTTITINGTSTGNLSFGVGGTGYGNIYVASNIMTIGTQTAANPVNFTIGGAEKARLDGSGNLLVGKTSTSISSTGIEAKADGQLWATRDGNPVLSLNRKTSDGSMAVFYKDGTTVGSIGINSNIYLVGTSSGLRIRANDIIPVDATGAGNDNALDLGIASQRWKDLYLSGTANVGSVNIDQNNAFTNTNITSANTNTDKGNFLRFMQVASGSIPAPDFFIGHAGDNSGDAVLRNASSSSMKFYTNNTEKVRITANGELLVGRTSTITFSTNTTDGIVLSPSRIDISAASLCRISQLRDSTGTYDRFYNGASIVGSITGTTSATAYNTSSDQRLKENITDADDAGSKVDAIQVRQFDWKADGSHQDYGMVAQELAVVAPEAVSVPEDPEDMMGVDYSKLVPMLIKEIQSLRNRVATLEGN
jgi:hypothetical protein